jgi:hypothetical protein
MLVNLRAAVDERERGAVRAQRLQLLQAADVAKQRTGARGPRGFGGAWERFSRYLVRCGS